MRPLAALKLLKHVYAYMLAAAILSSLWLSWQSYCDGFSLWFVFLLIAAFGAITWSLIRKTDREYQEHISALNKEGDQS